MAGLGCREPMTMHITDLGSEVVDRVRRRPECSRLACVEWSRGFTWRPLGVHQRIWSEPSRDDAYPTRWRVQVRSDLASGFDGSPARIEALSPALTAGSPGVVRSPRDRTRLELASTLHVRSANADRAVGLVAFLARLQAEEVRRLGRASALVAPGTEPVRAAETGQEPPDEDAGREETEPGDPTSPRGLGLWGREIQLSVELLSSWPGARAASTPRGLSATFAPAEELPDAGLTLLEVDALAQRPGLGRGLSILLVPPGRGSLREALALNEREISPGCHTDLMGGWSAREGVLHYSAFFPDAVCAEGLLTDLVLSATRRVEWLARQQGTSRSR